MCRSNEEPSVREAKTPAKRIPLLEPAARIYQAVSDLELLYPGRKFTPDGHMVGSIGEVIASAALGLRLHRASNPGHDAEDENGVQVQIKMIAGKSVALYGNCERLVVLRVVNPTEAEIVYDGPGEPAWSEAGKRGKNDQRTVSLSKLRRIAEKTRQPEAGL